MGLLCFVYLICSLRTNIAFVIIFATLVAAFGLLTGTYWHLALGHAALAARLQVVSHHVLYPSAVCQVEAAH